jgi:hypothetical protein
LKKPRDSTIISRLIFLLLGDLRSLNHESFQWVPLNRNGYNILVLPVFLKGKSILEKSFRDKFYGQKNFYRSMP